MNKFEEALSYLNSKHYEKAIKAFDSDLRENPENFSSLQNIALAKIHLGIRQNDKELLEQAIKNLEQARSITDQKFGKDHFPIAEANLKWAKEELEKLSE